MLYNLVGGGSSPWISAPTEDAWHNYASVLTGSKFQLWVDGSLANESNDTSSAFTTGPIYLGNINSTSTTDDFEGYIHHFRVQDTVESSFPIVDDTATYTPTFTVTPTWSLTQTPSVTPTITQTITQTITKTVTKTVTQTITPTFTVTPTVTPTQTPWGAYFLNATKNKDPHYDGPRFRWVDKVLNAIRNKVRE
jgi:hypothetical protein